MTHLSVDVRKERLEYTLRELWRFTKLPEAKYSEIQEYIRYFSICPSKYWRIVAIISCRTPAGTEAVKWSDVTNEELVTKSHLPSA